MTDANLLLGRLDPGHFLGGDSTRPRAAEQGFADFLRRIRQKIGFKTVPELAAGIVAVSNATMEKALRVISVERGHDPRDFALICFGGAEGCTPRTWRARCDCPKSSCHGTRRFLRTWNSAVGYRQRFRPAGLPSCTLRWRAAGLWLALEKRFARMERASRTELQQEGFPAHLARAERRLDLRYAGQSYELSTPFKRDFRRLFDRQHMRAYGYLMRGGGSRS